MTTRMDKELDKLAAEDPKVAAAEKKLKQVSDDLAKGVEKFKPWALVLRNVLARDDNLPFGQQVVQECHRLRVPYPPPEVEAPLMILIFKFKAQGPPPEGWKRYVHKMFQVILLGEDQK